MKLPKIRRLMGILARDMQRKQVKELLAAVPASYISQTEREDCKSAISFFVLLKKRTGTDEVFLSKLESVLSECKCTDFLTRIDEYKGKNPDLFQEPLSQLNLPDGTRTGFKPQPGQSEKFRGSLLQISRTIGKKQLEIMIGLSPIPEAVKQNINEGHELFEQMERHGCISENDSEMLQEMLELLSLQDALRFLYDYQQAYPPIIHDPPPPSAPQYASSSSLSVQAQYGSLPQYGSQYSISSRQPQSFHIQQPHSVPPLRSGSGSSNSGYGCQIGPSSYSSSSQYQPSYSSRQPSLSLSSGGSSSFAPLMPLSMPHMESGEENSSPGKGRQLVPSAVSPSLQHLPSLPAPMKLFPQQGEGGSIASSPPQSHAPSLAGSNKEDIYPRPLAKVGGATPNGSLNFQEGRGGPTSSGTYPRPLHEMGRSYQFPTNEVLNSRQKIPVDDTTAPPPAKIQRRSSPGERIGDGGCLSKTQFQSAQQSSNPTHHHQGQPPLPPSSSAEAPDTGDSLASFSTTGSEKFGVAISQGHVSNPGAGGGAAAANSLSSIEPYSGNVSFPVGVERMPSGLQQPTHDEPGAAVANQHPLPFNPHYAAPSSSAASLGSNPSYSASIDIPGSEEQNLEEGGEQLRNARPVGPVECARHPDDLVGPHVQQPFHHQYASHSASVAGASIPSNPSSYSGHPSSEFPSGIEERGVAAVGSETQSPAAGRSNKKKKSSSQAYKSPPTSVGKRKRSVLSKDEAKIAQGAADTQYESINEAAGAPSKISKYQQQLLEYENRRLAPYSQITEQGRNVAQASSENNVELRMTGSIQGALATAQAGEQVQRPSSSENILYQTAAEGNQLYPRLPLDTASFETASSSPSTGTALAGTKRTRSQTLKLENSEEKEVGKEEGEGDEEKGTAAKRQKTNKKPLTGKKQGLVSRMMGYFFRSSASNDDDQSQEEGCENTESENEYHSAKED